MHLKKKELFAKLFRTSNLGWGHIALGKVLESKVSKVNESRKDT